MAGALVGFHTSNALPAFGSNISKPGRKELPVCLRSMPVVSELAVQREEDARLARTKQKRVYLLDVHPLCYEGDRPDPMAFVRWMDAFLVKVALNDPIVAVLDGEKGNDFRRHILPSYKARRKRYQPLTAKYKWTKGYNVPDIEAALPCIQNFFYRCNIPFVKVENAEADDVVATLTKQVLQSNLKVVIASPDKDFKQLLAGDVQLVIPLPDLQRWSFYTIKDYIGHHKSEPSIELGLRCMLGDAADGVPGLADVSPGFGRKTALKLMRKHGSLEGLLKAAAIRTVGKPYIQNALRDHSSLLQNNLQVLSLRRDIEVVFQDDWGLARDISNDSLALHKLQVELQRLFTSQ